MSKQERKGLVPELRFPEFRDAEEWKRKPLALYIEQYSERAASNTELEVYSSTREGLKPQSEYYDGRNLVNDGEYGVVPDGYFVYRHMSDDDVFKFNLNQLGKNIAVSKEYPVFKTVNSDPRFLLNKLNEGQKFKRFAASQKKGGTRTRLYFNTLRTFESFFPAIDEQQKIADCLTSLDELITAQTQKLAALKTHKKGLMQQLFPAEGETVPKLRFPEFRDKGEWNEKEIGKFGKVVTGSTPSTVRPEFYGGGVPFVSPADISDLRFVDETKTTLTALSFDETRPIKANSILFVCIGSTIGKVAQNTRDCATNQQINSVILNDKHSSGFLYYALSLNAGRIANLAGKQAVPIINKSLFSSVILPVPKLQEQERIADCLGSVDELITAQTQKLTALKTHKKGLMQQLFPAMEEVAA